MGRFVLFITAQTKRGCRHTSLPLGHPSVLIHSIAGAFASHSPSGHHLLSLKDKSQPVHSLGSLPGSSVTQPSGQVACSSVPFRSQLQVQKSNILK